MANEIALLEQQFQPLVPHLQQVLASRMPVERLVRTVLISVERLPALLQCNRQSLFNAAMSAAVLGLEVDGVTGQAFIIPFKNKAQLVIGYKGYNTLAARSGLTITGGVVREGDDFKFDEARGLIEVNRKLGKEGERKIIAAWAKAAANDRPAVVKVLSIDEIMSIMAKSPGAKRDESPWRDPEIGFPAMAEKSAKRRLARSMPLNVMQSAARMEEAFEEQGVGSRIDPERGVVVDVLPASEASETPTKDMLIEHQPETDKPSPRPRSAHQGAADQPAPSGSANLPGGAGAVKIPDVQDYLALWSTIIADANSRDDLIAKWNSERELRNEITWDSRDQRLELGAAVSNKVKVLGEKKTK